MGTQKGPSPTSQRQVRNMRFCTFRTWPPPLQSLPFQQLFIASASRHTPGSAEATVTRTGAGRSDLQGDSWECPATQRGPNRPSLRPLAGCVCWLLKAGLRFFALRQCTRTVRPASRSSSTGQSRTSQRSAKYLGNDEPATQRMGVSNGERFGGEPLVGAALLGPAGVVGYKS